MIVLTCSNLSKKFGDKAVLQNIKFTSHDNDKVGVIGVNGAGKSTLFNILTGRVIEDSGEFHVSKNSKIGYLRQSVINDSSMTIWSEVLLAFSDLINLEKEIQILETKISNNSAPNNSERLMNKYSELTEKFSKNGGYEYISRARGVLIGLGFNENEFSMKVNLLSGGQKTRLQMAKLLLEQPDILLLDEPTNHLDIESIEWLESFLKDYKSCVLIISHDRYFLDAVCNKTLELENTHSNFFSGNYSKYMEYKKSQREILEKHYSIQQKEIKRMESFIEQQKRWNREKNIIAAKSRQKAIDRMEKVEKPENLPNKIKFNLSTSKQSGKDVLFVNNLGKEFPDKHLFSNISFKLNKNDRLFLIGPNGCGKSTLLKIINQKIKPTSGEFTYGHNVKIAFYDQELENLNLENSLLDEITYLEHSLSETELRNILASFLFTNDDVFKKISSLSGGEKSRIALIKILLSNANLLILDEPTNHLDISSKESIETALLNYNGTIISVSHDRYFIRKLATKILEFNPKEAISFEGSYTDYLEYKKNIMLDTQKNIKPVTPISEAKASYVTQKDQKSKLRKLENSLKTSECKIAELEKNIEFIKMQMTSTEISTDHVKLTELSNKLKELELELEKQYEFWDDLTTEHDQFVELGKE